MEFKGFGKIPRLYRTITITEKIDGTNACIAIAPLSEQADFVSEPMCIVSAGEGGIDSVAIWTQSRKRHITPDNDNHGFARWAQEHKEELAGLGPGYHFGEWWGSGINRGYGLTKGEKKFSLFNVHRFDSEPAPSCCEVVPVLYTGEYDESAILATLRQLQETGSHAAPGFDDPEGIMVWHHHARQYFKITLEDDATGKGKSDA